MANSFAGRLQPLEQALVHRPQQEGGAADPVGQGRAVEGDALTGIDLRLPIERTVIGMFRDEHLGMSQKRLRLSAEQSAQSTPQQPRSGRESEAPNAREATARGRARALGV